MTTSPIIKMPGLVGAKKLSEDQLQIVEILKETLAQTLEGNITSIGIVACMKTGYATLMGGRQASDLYMGAASLQKKILDTVEVSSLRGEQNPDFK